MLAKMFPLLCFTLFSTSLFATDPRQLCQGSGGAILEGKSNLVSNADFAIDTGQIPTGWQLLQGSTSQLTYDESQTLTMHPALHQSVTLSQQLHLKPRTKYTLSLCVKGDSSHPPTVMIGDDRLADPGVQRVKTQSYLEPDQQDNKWTMYRFVFYTTTGSVRLALSGYQNTNGVSQSFRYPIIVEGTLAAPIPKLPDSGQNLVLNGSFSEADTHWVFDKDSEITKRDCEGKLRFAKLTASPDFSARVVQSLAFSLSAGHDYILKAKVRTLGKDVNGRVFLTIKGQDPAPKAGNFNTNGAWQTISYPFTAPNNAANIKVMLESYKQASNGHVDITDVQLIAQGNEQYPSGDKAPQETTTPFIQDFSQYSNGQALNSSAWLLPNKTWGGDNNGVMGKNVAFSQDAENGQFLRLNAYGSNATSNQVRQGSAIATKDYYASGVYLVCARMPKSLGVVSAFWPFHYIAYKPTEKEYWDEPNPIRNTEIDWELPTSNLDNSSPVTYQYARLNSWGGQFGGEGGNDTERVDLTRYNTGQLVNEDNAFHQYGIIWYAGHDNPDGSRTPGYVKWTFNKDCMAHPAPQYSNAIHHSLNVVQNTKQNLSTAGQSYGQDNIPFRAARFWLGAWFPGSADRPYHAGGQTYWGWGGTPDFDTDHLDIKWVAIYPWSSTSLAPTANRDKWEAETAPDAGNWSPGSAYPIVGQSPDTPVDPDPQPDDPTPQTGTVSINFAADFPGDKAVTISWLKADNSNQYEQKQLTKSNNGFKFTPKIGSQIIVDGNVCWDNHGDTARETTSGIFLAVQKTWIKCRLQ